MGVKTQERRRMMRSEAKPYHTGEAKDAKVNLRYAQHLDPTVDGLQQLCPGQ